MQCTHDITLTNNSISNRLPFRFVQSLTVLSAEQVSISSRVPCASPVKSGWKRAWVTLFAWPINRATTFLLLRSYNAAVLSTPPVSKRCGAASATSTDRIPGVDEVCGVAQSSSRHCDSREESTAATFRSLRAEESSSAFCCIRITASTRSSDPVPGRSELAPNVRGDCVSIACEDEPFA
jgi:hypothetical protein